MLDKRASRLRTDQPEKDAAVFDPRRLLADYKQGLGYREGDILVPRDGANPVTYDVIEKTVVVLSQDSIAPHQYHVVGARLKPKTPSDRFVRFSINGHDWKRK